MLLRRNSLYLNLFLIFCNFWILRIFKLNPLIGSILVGLTLVLMYSRKTIILTTCLFILLIIQFKTTEITNLSTLDNDQQRVQQERIQSYSPTYIDLFIKKIWIWPGLWIEKNNLVISLSRIEENLFENLNINKFFFGGFPGNKASDFEKFPFVLLPTFIIGVYFLIKRKEYKTFSLFYIPLIFLAFIGNKSSFGPVSLFPFFALACITGLQFLDKKIRNKQSLYVVIVIVLILNLILQVSYEKV